MKHSIMLALLVSITSIILHPSARKYNQFFRASYAYRQGNHAEAQRWFDKFAETDEESPWHLKTYAQFLVDSNQIHKLPKLIPILDEYFPDDPPVQLAIARSLEMSGNRPAAHTRIINLQEQHPSHPEVTILAVQSALTSQQPTRALQILNRFINNHTRQATLATFLLIKAQVHYTLGQKNEAAHTLNECVELNPNHIQAWLLKLQLENELGLKKEALASMQAIQGLHAGFQSPSEINSQTNHNPEPQTGRGKEFDKAIQFIAQKKYQGAIPYLLKYIGEHPQDNQAYFVTLQTLMQVKDFERAFVLFNTILSKQPEQEIWYLLLLAGISTKKELEQAIALIKHIAEKNPCTDLPKLYLAELMFKANNTTQADAILSELIRSTSNPVLLAIALETQSTLAAQQDNLLLAISLLERAHENDPSNSKSLQTLLKLYRLTPEYHKRGLRLTSKLLKQNPDSGTLHLLKGEFCLACGQVQEAINCLKLVTLLEPANADAWIMLSQAKMLLGEKTNAFYTLKQHSNILRRTPIVLEGSQKKEPRILER